MIGSTIRGCGIHSSMLMYQIIAMCISNFGEVIEIETLFNHLSEVAIRVCQVLCCQARLGRALTNAQSVILKSSLTAVQVQEFVATIVVIRCGRRAIRQLSDEKQAVYRKRRDEINEKWPPATVQDFVDHIDHAVKLIGIDHVGISSDFDGGGGIEGWNDASETFNVTLELVRRGYSEEEISKIWGGNLLRVWREVERVASEMQATASNN